MHLTEEELEQIIKEEFNNLINEEEIDEKLFSVLKNIGKGLLSKASDIFSTKPNPKASQGVGRAFAPYKVPQKRPVAKEPKEKPQQEPSTALAIRPSTAISGDVIDQTPDDDIERGAVRAKLKPRPQLPAAKSPAQQPLKTSGELPPSENIPLQLAAPKKIGILKDYGSLMSSTEEQDYKNLYDNSIAYFSKTQYYSNLNQQQKTIATKNIDTVLKHLVATKRIIQNPTISPVDEQESRKTPSLQQIGEIDFNSWYARSLISTTKKYFGNSIPGEIIEFVIKFLFQSGRLAISQRLFNQLIHTNDPRVGPTDKLGSEQQTQQKESINYNKLYESWKIYVKTGVKI